MAASAHFDRDGDRPASGRPFGPGLAYSAIAGVLAELPVPARLRGFAYRTFARAVGANLDETELPLSEYPSLGDFFARRLRDGARVIDPAPTSVISPCDGVIAARGTVQDGILVQCKGRQYRLADLLADEALAADLDGGSYCTIYLSPRDYHRVHAPLAADLRSYDYIPGALWPVNAWATARREGLLARNERVIIHMDGRGHAAGVGRFALVMVAASGVGNMRLVHAPDSVHLRGAHQRHSTSLDGLHVERGDELGAFRLGSTVVLVFPPGVALEGEAGQAVRFGERLGRHGGAR